MDINKSKKFEFDVFDHLRDQSLVFFNNLNEKSSKLNIEQPLSFHSIYNIKNHVSTANIKG